MVRGEFSSAVIMRKVVRGQFSVGAIVRRAIIRRAIIRGAIFLQRNCPRSLNRFHNILRLFDFTTSEIVGDYYL